MYAERLHAAAATDATDWRCRVVVASDGKTAMDIVDELRMGDVNADPAGKIPLLHPDIHPGMAFRM